MKGGFTLKTLMGLILLLLLAFLFFSIFIMPVQTTGEELWGIKDFRWYCMFWAEDGYQGKFADIKGVKEPMHKHCTKELGIPCPAPSEGAPDYGGCMQTETQWEKCRDACRLKKPEE